MSRKVDFDGRDWAAHAQDHWLVMAGRPNFPDYLRVVFVAYGRHHANGHALLDRGELAYFLVRQDGTLPDRRIVWRAVREAVDLGFLVAGSQLLCLIVGSHDVQGGRATQTADVDVTTPAVQTRTSAMTADVSARTSAMTLDV